MSYAKPGERRGGRKPGSKNKKTAALQAQVAATGKTPLDVMLGNMRFADTQAAEIVARLLRMDTPTPESFDLIKTIAGFRDTAQTCARDAAPYVHARLAAVQVTNATLADMSDDELLSFLAAIRSFASASRGAKVDGRAGAAKRGQAARSKPD